MQNRFKSWVFWMGIASIISLVLTTYGLWGFIGMTNEVFQKLVELVLAVLAGVGVINNPTDKNNW